MANESRDASKLLQSRDREGAVVSPDAQKLRHRSLAVAAEY